MIRPPRKQRGKNVKSETGMDKVQKGKPVVVRHRLKTGDIQARLTAPMEKISNWDMSRSVGTRSGSILPRLWKEVSCS